MNGTIKSLPQDHTTGERRGYGFIRDDAGGNWFFHKRAIQAFGPAFADLQEGDPVTFTPIEHPKGPRAIEVRILKGNTR